MAGIIPRLHGWTRQIAPPPPPPWTPPALPAGAYGDWDALLLDPTPGSSVASVSGAVAINDVEAAATADVYSTVQGKSIAVPFVNSSVSEWLRQQTGVGEFEVYRSLTLVEIVPVRAGDTWSNAQSLSMPIFQTTSGLVFLQRSGPNAGGENVWAGGNWFDESVLAPLNTRPVEPGVGHWRAYVLRATTVPGTPGGVRVRIRHASRDSAGVWYDGESDETGTRESGGFDWWTKGRGWQTGGAAHFGRAVMYAEDNDTSGALSDADTAAALVNVVASMDLDGARALLEVM